MKDSKLYTDNSHCQPDNDLILWQKFLEGDDVSFETMYRKYIHSLFRYGIQFTNDKELVQDAIHDVFVRIYNTKQNLNNNINLKFYLFTALKNSLYNIFKKELSFEKMNEDELNEIIDQNIQYETIVPLENTDIKEEVMRLMEFLTDRQREVIYYRFIEELDIEEISSIMNMNYQSVQNLIQRSLKKMRNTGLPFILTVLLIFRVIS